MALQEIFKQQSLVNVINERLHLRLPALLVSQALNNAGAAILFSQHSPAVAGEQNIAIRVKAQDTQFNDVIGNAQVVYSPMIIQVILESSTIAHVPLLLMANMQAMQAELERLGCKMEIWLNANATVPALSQFNADGSISGSTFECEVASDLLWPLSGQ